MESIELNSILEDFESLPFDDKEYFLEIISKRMIEEKRNRLSLRIREAEANYKSGNTKKGNVDDLLKDLNDKVMLIDIGSHDEVY